MKIKSNINRSELEENIFDIFPQIFLDIRFTDSLCADTLGKKKFDLNEKWKNWTEIPDFVFKQGCQSAIWHMPKNDLVMIFPRYLLEMAKKEEPKYPIDAAIVFIINLFIEWVETDVVKQIFLPQQMQVIFDSIDYHISRECYLFVDHDDFGEVKKWRAGEKYFPNGNINLNSTDEFSRQNNRKQLIHYWNVEKKEKKIRSWIDYDLQGKYINQ